jgi:hypothetical protein
MPLERVKELVAAMEVPFDPSQIEWRVMNTRELTASDGLSELVAQALKGNHGGRRDW